MCRIEKKIVKLKMICATHEHLTYFLCSYDQNRQPIYHQVFNNIGSSTPKVSRHISYEIKADIIKGIKTFRIYFRNFP